MKLFAALLLSLSCALIVNAQTPASTCAPLPKTDWVRDELKGTIKTIKTFETRFVVSEKTGRVERRPRLLQNETEYDAKGGREGGGETFTVPEGMEFTGVRHVCTANGKLKELRFVSKDGSTYPRKIYVYDEKGQKIEETDYFQNGSIQAKSTYVYDAAGNVIEEINTDRVLPRNTYKYDSRRNKIEEKQFNSDGLLYDIWFFNYDARDRLIKRTHMDKLGRLVDQFFYEYHEDGRPLAEIRFFNFCRTSAGDFCKSYITSGDGLFSYVSKTKYQYDSQGNWIKKTEWDKDAQDEKPAWALSEIVEREIVYHRN